MALAKSKAAPAGNELLADNGKRDSTEGIINIARPGSVVAKPPKGQSVTTGGSSNNSPRTGGN